MTWPVYAVLPVLAGFGAYFCYLLFLVIVLIKDGAEGVERIAKVVPAPKWWIEPIAKAIASRGIGSSNKSDREAPSASSSLPPDELDP